MLGVVWLVWRVQCICSSFDFLINNFGSIRGNQKIFGIKKKRRHQWYDFFWDSLNLLQVHILKWIHFGTCKDLEYTNKFIK